MEKLKYGYHKKDYTKFKQFAWKVLISFGMTYMFFYNSRALTSTLIGIFDWAAYMGVAIQATLFGFVKDTFGWSAIFITIGCLYVVMFVLTLLARKMKTKNI